MNPLSIGSPQAAAVAAANEMQPSPKAWWRHGYVWLVLAGPLLVIVAGLVTFWIAQNVQPDLVDQGYYRVENQVVLTPSGEVDKSQLPAMKGRNHAVTPSGDISTQKP